MVAAVKICGIRDVRGAEAVGASGATHGGFVFVPGRRRAVTPDAARLLAPRLGSVEAVGVFLDASYDEIRKAADTAHIRTLQLHGSEPPTLGEKLTKDGYRVLRAISVKGPLGAPLFKAWMPFVQAFLLDAPTAGHGRAFSSAHLPLGQTPLRALSGRPTWLAGGLNPQALAHRPEISRFDGLDVASGVEVEGRQDPQRIHAFVEAVRRTTISC